jgi:hypothetical protein
VGVEPTRDVYSPILDLKTQGVISYQIEIKLFTDTYPLIYGQIMTEVENLADQIYNTK